MNKNHYPLAFLLLIGVAAFIMYGGFLVPKVDLQQYKDVCIKYQTAADGTYTKNEILSLINKVNYLFPASASDLPDPLEKEIKICANALSERLNKSAN